MCGSIVEKDMLENYKVIRSRIEFEYSQIGNRLNWLIASQAFLFNALVVNIKTEQQFQNIFEAMDIITKRSLLYPILPFLGLFISLFVMIGTLAAILRIADLKIRENTVRSESKYPVYTIPERRPIHHLGLLPPIFIPVSFFLVWFFIISPNLIIFGFDINLFSSPVNNLIAMSTIFLFIFIIGLGMWISIIITDNCLTKDIVDKFYKNEQPRSKWQRIISVGIYIIVCIIVGIIFLKLKLTTGGIFIAIISFFVFVSLLPLIAIKSKSTSETRILVSSH